MCGSCCRTLLPLLFALLIPDAAAARPACRVLAAPGGKRWLSRRHGTQMCSCEKSYEDQFKLKVACW